MKIRNLLIVAAAALTMYSCTPSQEKLSNNIKEAEAAYEQSNGSHDENEAALLDAYEAMIKHYPEEANDARFKIGELYMNLKVSSKAILNFKYLYDNVPDYKESELVILYLGFIYSNQVFDLEAGERYYKDFLERFPDSKYADDVKTSLKYLGKTPNEIIELIEAETAAMLSDSLAI